MDLQFDVVIIYVITSIVIIQWGYKNCYVDYFCMFNWESFFSDVAYTDTLISK